MIAQNSRSASNHFSLEAFEVELDKIRLDAVGEYIVIN